MQPADAFKNKFLFSKSLQKFQIHWYLWNAEKFIQQKQLIGHFVNRQNTCDA